jgi:hypothetical protein
MFEPLFFFASSKALVQVALASNILPISGASEPRSLATLLAFLTMLMAFCIPARAVRGSIISYLPFAIQGTLLCGYKHLLSMPTAHNDIQFSLY